jgi:hypothetical protein
MADLQDSTFPFCLVVPWQGRQGDECGAGHDGPCHPAGQQRGKCVAGVQCRKQVTAWLLCCVWAEDTKIMYSTVRTG